MIIHKCIQLSDEWFDLHKGRPSASAFDRFITAARGDYSKQAMGYVAHMLVVETIGQEQGQYMSDDMHRGVFMEDEARSWYEFEFDCEITEVGAIENKGAIWSPDGIIGNGWTGSSGERGAVEFKVPKATTHVGWLLDGRCPDKHKPQCHGAIHVGELDWIDFVSYCPGFKALCIRVVPDDYTKKVEAALAKFIKEYADAKKRILREAA